MKTNPSINVEEPVADDGLTIVCCVCGCHLQGPWPAEGEVSHSYCPRHFQQAKREIEEYLDRELVPRLRTAFDA